MQITTFISIGGIYLKKIKYKNLIYIIFIVLFILYSIYFILCLPTIIILKVLGDINAPLYEFWETLDKCFMHHKLLKKFFYTFVYNIPMATIPITIIINTINIIFGFINFRKKTWYYVILFLSLIITWMLIECYYLYTFEPV